MKLLSALFLIISCTLAGAAEFRTWTSNNGTTIEAQLVSFQNGTANLSTKEPRNIPVRVNDLSLADRQYLIDFADADKDLLLKGEATVPEHAFRKQQDMITKHEDKLEFPDISDADFEVYETPHYVIAASKGIKITGLAETAEACWHGMAFQHLEFRENWGDTKLLIVVPETKELYSELRKYEVNALTAAGHPEYAARTQATWDRTGSQGITPPADAVTKFKLKERGDIFNGDLVKKFRDDFDPFQTHVISSTLFAEQAGGVSSISSNGYFAIATGHAFYKEIQLAKKTETRLISVDSYEGEIDTKSGFEDGTSWARSLRKLVRKGTITPKLEQMLNLKSAADLTPETLVTMYSLSCYMQSTQERIASYAKLIRRINTSDQVPVPGEFVKFFGFETVEEFEKDWTEYVSSTDFR